MPLLSRKMRKASSSTSPARYLARMASNLSASASWAGSISISRCAMELLRSRAGSEGLSAAGRRTGRNADEPDQPTQAFLPLVKLNPTAGVNIPRPAFFEQLRYLEGEVDRLLPVEPGIAH